VLGSNGVNDIENSANELTVNNDRVNHAEVQLNNKKNKIKIK
jgi:hypothetical protein